MSIFIQEVLNLLQRKQDKKKLQLKRDWFEFGRTKSSFLGKSSYAPKMDHYTIRFDDLKCEIISGLVGGTGTEHTLPVWSTIDINNCKVQTIVDSIFSQDAVATEGLVSGDFRVTGNTILEQNLQVNENANINLQLTAGSANITDLTEDRIVIVGLNGELEDDVNFTFDGTTFNIGQGNFTVDVTTGNTQIIGTLNVDDQATFASANVEDLTEDRLVIAGPDGELEDSPNLTFDGDELTTTSLTVTDLTEDRVVIVGENGQLEDDANFTFNGVELNIGTGNFTIQQSSGNTQIVGTLNVDDQSTLASANIEDLTNDRIVIVGVDGELEDDSNFTMDGTTFTANVNVIHGTDVPTGVPTHTTTINSNLKLEGPVYDSQGNIGGLNKVLVGLADGRVKWQDDDLVEALTYGSLWQGDPTNYKVELAIGTADQILISDGTTFAWQDNPAAIVGEACDIYRLPLWTPDSNTLGCSILIQDGNSTTPATKVTIEGNAIVEGDIEVNGTTKLDTLTQDDTLVQVLVRDVANDNLIKFRDVSSIKPQVGFDTLDMLPDGWASTNGNFNAYIKLDDTIESVKNIKDMDWLVDGDRVVVIAENTKTGSLLADNAIRFPSWQYPGPVGRVVSNYTSWNQASIDSGWTGAIDNGYETSTLLYGEKLKFKAEMYADPDSLNNQLNWDACCKIYSNNTCPTGSNGATTIDEDTSFSGLFNGIDDGYGGYGLTYSIVSGPSNGTVTLTDSSTGAFTYTPNTNYFGTDVITWEVTDGYCTSNQYTFTITINAVDDAPVWTSTDPVTANTYPNLTGGDTWTYNWTVADADTPCASLTFPSQTIPSWLTFTNNGDCTGTLTGTFPPTGGIYPVQLNVSDGTNTTSQSFDIGGLAVDNDTYFVSWFDGSGSMDTTGVILSAISSTATVVARSDGSGSGTNTLRLNPGISNDVGMYVDDPSGNAFNGYELLVVGMTVSGTGIPAGTTIVTAPAGTAITLSNNHTTSAGDIITFARTDAQKAADYADISTFRNLLQDFYATGQTYAEETAAGVPHNSATNGQDRYDTHVKFGWDNYSNEGNGERQIQYLANLGIPIDRGAGQLFENASTVVIMAWGDESDDWYYDRNGTGTLFTDKTSGFGLRVANDVAEVQQFITTTETNAGSNQIYRGIWFSVAANTPYRDIGQGLQNGTASQFGGVAPNGWTDADLLTAQSSGTPARIQYAGQTGDTRYPNGITANNNAAGYYRSVVLAKLNDSGFTTLT